MQKTWTIGRQIALGITFPIVVLILLGIVSYRSAQNLMDTTRKVANGYERRSKLHLLQLWAQEAEIGERAFVLTGQESYLEPYQTALAGGGKLYEELAQETTDPRQKQALDKLYGVFRERLALMGQMIDLRRQQGLEATSLAITQSRFYELDEAIDQLTKEVRLYQTEANQDHALSAQIASDDLSTIMWIGALITVLVTIVTAVLVVRRLNRQIGSVVQQMQSASAELQAAASQQSKGASGQVAAATEVSTTIQELVATSRQIADSAQQVNRAAGETATAARTGDEVVRSAQTAIDGARHKVDRVVLHMLDLGKKSQAIGDIGDLINELAEQTNLLAINATIEAAGAGDAGRRFSVVANEIRKLADRVGGSTREIRSLVEETRTAANTTVLATEDGSKAVDTGSRSFVEVASSFARISAYAQSTVQTSREIELSTKQQRTAVEQVSQAMTHVAQAARSSEASSAETLRTAGELASLSQQLVRLIRRDAATAM